MIKCKPERNPKQALLLVAVCAIVFLTVGYVSAGFPQYKWITQAIALASITMGIFFVYRYTLVEMIYSVGGGTLVIVKKVGNKETPVLSLDVSTAKFLITKEQYKDDQKNKRYVVTKQISLNQNLRPAISYVYVTEFNGKCYAIEFEPNQPFVEALLNEIDLNKPDREQ